MMYVSSAFQIRILNRLRLLTIFRVGYKIKTRGVVFKIPVIDNKEGLIYHLKIGEPYLLQVFQQLNDSGKYVFLDAGVNFGQTLLKVKAINPSMPYIGFEPSGLCSYYTSRLITVNNFKDAQLIRCALADSAGVLTLHSQSDGDTRATIIDHSIKNDEDTFQELVPVVTLDSLIPIITGRGKEFILKVDVEGAEWLVFQGAQLFITEYRPLVVFENLPANENEERSEEQQKIAHFFIDKQYSLFLLNEIQWKLENILTVSNKNDYSKTNYIAIPGEKIAALDKLIHGGKLN